jgi:UDP-glucose 4-epimerase
MRALVVGGSGFIGSHVVDMLRESDIEVTVFDLRKPDFRDDVDWVEGDVRDAEAVHDAVQEVDAVFHLAAVADVNHVHDDPATSEAINVRGTLNILEAARASERLQRVVYASTTWVYGGSDDQDVDEDSRIDAPDHFYTATKLAGEFYCKSYSKLYDVPVTILRYGIPYGPRSREAAVIPLFVRKVLNGEPLTLSGGGLQFRKFVYVRDLAEGHVLALKDEARNRVFNLAGSERVTIKQIAETVQELLGKVSVEETPPRPGDFLGKNVSSSRALNELGWKPRTPFIDGVRQYIDWRADAVSAANGNGNGTG